MHTADLNLALLAPLGITGFSEPVRLNIPQSAREAASQVRAAHDISSPFVIFHPGSARPEKFWQVERWAEVIDYAAGLNVRCVLTGGPAANESAHVRDIAKRTRAKIVDLSGKIDILTLTALIEDARLLVTVDTAPLHLAAAVGTPLVALFGPTNPFHWAPRRENALVLQGSSPSPITNFSPAQARGSMNEISTRAVIDAMESVLSAPPARSSAAGKRN